MPRKTAPPTSTSTPAPISAGTSGLPAPCFSCGAFSGLPHSGQMKSSPTRTSTSRRLSAIEQ
jgi:hypothetical protein